MKNLVLAVLMGIFLLPLASCSSSRDVAERRSLMMPKVSEMPRNHKKYKEVVYSKKQTQKNKAKGNHKTSYCREF